MEEVQECIANRTGKFLEDMREDHKSDPPTQWFIAETDSGRQLKIVFILKDGDVVVKTAYVPNEDEKRIYIKYA
ncbi:ADP-ribosyl-(dinitrogen reductase) hydrolase [Marinobacter sp. F3R11]|uniref:ADP-ribosyl-(dinitrogen reductase) hydrolase n=1 Tax=Marinobacter sp. F3R11 TaxID=2267231 RepID=UPI0021C8D5A3|nr:ADP-ribosyl-(dinitrogen reductase) hydrolase [Marinobacter sp. F3R11]